MTRKICVVITARPSYSRVKTALKAISDHPELELQLVVTASALLDRYGCVSQYIEDDGFIIAKKAFTLVEGQSLLSMAKTTGLSILEVSSILNELQPDFVISIADRFETIATAISASYLNIPLIHLQGGEVTGSIDEKVRHAITKLSDYHFVCTPLSQQRVIQMGEDPDNVFVVGCPSIDIAKDNLLSPSIEFDPIATYGGVGPELNFQNDYLVVLQHPDTALPYESSKNISETIEAVIDINYPTMWFWPNVDAGSDLTSKTLRKYREKHELSNIHFFKNMRSDDFLKILIGCRCLIGNSSVAIRECSYLGVPAVNIGDRQFGRERAKNVIDCDYNRQEIKTAVMNILSSQKPGRVCLYGDGSSGVRIAQLLASISHKHQKVFTDLRID